MAASPEKKSSQGLADKSAAISETNEKDWQAAGRYGITEDTLDKTHPELVQAKEQFGKSAESAVSKGKWITGVSAVVGAAIPLALRKPKNKWLRAAVTIVAAGTAAVAGLAASVYGLGRPLVRKSIDIVDRENKALEQDIGTAVASGKQPQCDVPVKEFAANVAPRDASYTAQASKDSGKETQAAIGT